MFEVDIDCSAIGDALRIAQVQLEHGTRRAVEDAAEAARRQGRARRPYRDRTGNLTAKVYISTASVSARDCEVDVDWTMPYAGFVDEGTRFMPAYSFIRFAIEAGDAVLSSHADSVIERVAQTLG